MNLPPLHPAIVHFPIALIGFWFIAELIGYFSRSETARTVAWWSLVGAVIGGALSVLFGYIDMWRASLAAETHELVHTHLKLGWVLVVSITALAIWSWFLRRQPGRAPGGGFLTAAVFVFALTMFQGWYGGEMAYAHGAGVAAAGQGMRPPEIARQRLTPIAEALRKLPFIGEEKGRHGGGHKHGAEALAAPAAPSPAEQ
ncbi:hypothetical protein BH20VER3_BH20VER3_03350 [soil metagenome]